MFCVLLKYTGGNACVVLSPMSADRTQSPVNKRNNGGSAARTRCFSFVSEMQQKEACLQTLTPVFTQFQSHKGYVEYQNNSSVLSHHSQPSLDADRSPCFRADVATVMSDDPRPDLVKWLRWQNFPDAESC